MKSSISAKGQLTIPVAMRRELGLSPGTSVSLELREEGILIRKSSADAHPVDKLFGTLNSTQAVDEILNEMRGLGIEQ